ncbi:resolvase protein, partial [Actinomyces johnsonii F0510]
MHHGSVVIIGYARVSTREQQLAMQIDALKSAGCTKILTDVASGAVSARPGLDLALDALGEGDTLVVWRLDRLGRSLSHLVSTVDDLAARGVFLRSLHEAIDTTTAA